MTMKRLLPCIVAAMVLWSARSAYASTLTIAAPQQAVPVDGMATVDVRLDSEGATVNAVQATVSYDASMLDFVSALPDPSFVSLWTESPRLVHPGIITMSGGKPNGGFLLEVPIAHLTFRPLKEGTADLSIVSSDSGVYLNDGYGTPTPLTVKPLTLAISGASHILAQPTSPSHGSQSDWSNTRTFIVAWSVFPEYEVSFQLSRDPLAIPDDTPDENIGIMTYPNLTDGVWYFTFKERARGSSWESVYRRIVHIDATAPESFTLLSTRSQQGGTGLLSFHANDATSGVASYLVRITEKPWWNPWNAKVTTMRAHGVLAFDDRSNITEVDVTALDRAGNARTEQWFGEHPRRNQLIFMASLLLGAAVLAGLLLAVVLLTRRVTRTPTRTTR